MNIIEADSEESWPQELLKALDKDAGGIAAYHKERARLDRAAEDDVMLRIHRPANPYQTAWDLALRMAGEAIAAAHLVGFHATRLTDQECGDIRANGLRSLSKALFEARIAAATSAGLLIESVADMLRARNQVLDGNRNGMSWFCFSRAMLSDESGVERLLRSWGGEALYNSHERDALTGPALTAIGSPCIVAAAVPIGGIETFMEVSERLLNVWCAKRAISTGHQPEFEGYVRTDIPGNQILRIIRFGDPEFTALTRHESWRKPLS